MFVPSASVFKKKELEQEFKRPSSNPLRRSKTSIQEKPKKRVDIDRIGIDKRRAI